jgi:hypothetical protein
MAALYSGNLLVKVRQRPFAGLLAGPQLLAIPGYRLEPLFKDARSGRMKFDIQFFPGVRPDQKSQNRY